MSEDEKDQQNGSEDAAQPAPTALEWTVRLVSAAVLLALTGYIVWTAFQPTVNPHFEFAFEIADMEERDGQWVVPLDVTNRGTSTLENVVVRLQLLDGERVIEEPEVTFALIGEEEVQKAEFWFTSEPVGYLLKPSVVGYRLP